MPGSAPSVPSSPRLWRGDALPRLRAAEASSSSNRPSRPWKKHAKHTAASTASNSTICHRRRRTPRRRRGRCRRCRAWAATTTPGALAPKRPASRARCSNVGRDTCRHCGRVRSSAIRSGTPNSTPFTLLRPLSSSTGASVTGRRSSGSIRPIRSPGTISATRGCRRRGYCGGWDALARAGGSGEARSPWKGRRHRHSLPACCPFAPAGTSPLLEADTGNREAAEAALADNRRLAQLTIRTRPRRIRSRGLRSASSGVLRHRHRIGPRRDSDRRRATIRPCGAWPRPRSSAAKR